MTTSNAMPVSPICRRTISFIKFRPYGADRFQKGELLPIHSAAAIEFFPDKSGVPGVGHAEETSVKAERRRKIFPERNECA
jgi:hypothetical protein